MYLDKSICLISPMPTLEISILVSLADADFTLALFYTTLSAISALFYFSLRASWIDKTTIPKKEGGVLYEFHFAPFFSSCF